MICLVNAGSNSSSTKSYSFTDKNPRPGSNFYRLKIADNDGKDSYSKIVEVTASFKKSLSIFPNPVQDIIYVEVNGGNEKSNHTNF